VRQRIRRAAHLIAAAAVLTAIAGCGAGRPVRYYTLERPPIVQHAATNRYPVSLLVGRLRSTRLLEDDRIVYGMNAVEMGVYSGHRWAEPPAEMIETMLLERLRATAQYRSVQRLAGAARGDYVLRGRLISLKELDLPSGIVGRFAIELDLFQPKTGAVVWTQSYDHDEPVEKKTVTGVVGALQRNVEAGLAQLTADLGQYFASQASR
jgi:ABC-type uncharacterized transport system auxiliary subunit